MELWNRKLLAGFTPAFPNYRKAAQFTFYLWTHISEAKAKYVEWYENDVKGSYLWQCYLWTRLEKIQALYQKFAPDHLALISKYIDVSAKIWMGEKDHEITKEYCRCLIKLQELLGDAQMQSSPLRLVILECLQRHIQYRYSQDYLDHQREGFLLKAIPVLPNDVEIEDMEVFFFIFRDAVDFRWVEGMLKVFKPDSHVDVNFFDLKILFALYNAESHEQQRQLLRKKIIDMLEQTLLLLEQHGHDRTLEKRFIKRTLEQLMS